MKIESDLKFIYSINELMTLTGQCFRTIKKRLENLPPVKEAGNGGTFYDLRQALPKLYQLKDDEPKSLIEYRVLREKSEAKLAESKSQKLRFELALMKKQFISIESAEKTWASLISSFRSRMLAIPSRAALIVSNHDTPQEVEATLKEFIHEALQELSSHGNLTAKEHSLVEAAHSPSSEAEANTVGE
jgi:hypothetical protein